MRTTHWLQENKAQRYPRRNICLDVEARITLEGPIEHQRFRLAVCSFDRLAAGTLELEQSERAYTTSIDELWDWIEERCSPRHRTVLWAHNLGYDLRLTHALPQLVQRGWELKAFTLDNYRTWLRWRKGTATLAMVDSSSYIGASISKIGQALKLPKPPLPKPDANQDEWLNRCNADVTILRETVLQLLWWFRDNNCGDFRMTGPAQASACFRHRFLGDSKLLVHTNEGATTAERRAAWTGRCELWQHGEIAHSLYEWDYSLAYARIAQQHSVPVRLRGSSENITTEQALKLSNRFAVLAECELDNPTPTAPTEQEGRILWPTGKFRTTLWAPELRLAVANGATAKIDRVWLYHRAPILREWATWVLDSLEGEDREPHPIGALVLKRWARQLIGRFGLRYAAWEKIGTPHKSTLDYMPYLDMERGETGTFLLCGDDLFERNGSTEARDSAPAITSYIMAVARCNLWETMCKAGFENLVYCDTDSVIVTMAGSSNLRAATVTGLLPGLRLKSIYPHGIFYSPRNIILADLNRTAGLPRNATPVGQRRYRAIVWEGFTESIRHKRPNEVALFERMVELSDVDHRRQHYPNGHTGALVLT